MFKKGDILKGFRVCGRSGVAVVTYVDSDNKVTVVPVESDDQARKIREALLGK